MRRAGVEDKNNPPRSAYIIILLIMGYAAGVLRYQES